MSRHLRRSFFGWRETAKPRVTFEMASQGTWRENVKEKRELYTRLGIAEYFIFDPEGEFISPRLQGFRLENGQSVPMVPDADGGLICAELGLRLVPEGLMLRLYDLATGAAILTREEQAEQAARRADEEKGRADEEKEAPMRWRRKSPACDKCSLAARTAAPAENPPVQYYFFHLMSWPYLPADFDREVRLRLGLAAQLASTTPSRATTSTASTSTRSPTPTSWASTASASTSTTRTPTA